MMSGNPRFLKAVGAAALTVLLLGIACHAGEQTSLSCHGDSGGSHAANTGAVAGSTANSKRHEVRLNWKPSADAVKGYIIERAEFGKVNAYKQISVTPIRETSCTDYEVAAGQSYLYRAKSVGRNGQVSKPSNVAKATVPRP